VEAEARPWSRQTNGRTCGRLNRFRTEQQHERRRLLTLWIRDGQLTETRLKVQAGALWECAPVLEVSHGVRTGLNIVGKRPG